MGDPTTVPVPQQAPQVPVELLITQSVATTIGVLIALAVAVLTYVKMRQDRKRDDERAREDRDRYETQLATLQRAERDRIEAQARRIVPTVFPAEMFGPNVWTVRVVNSSSAPITELGVQVVAFDADGKEVENGLTKSSAVGLDQAIERMVRPIIRSAMNAGMGSIQMSGPGLSGPIAAAMGARADQAANAAAPQMSARVREAVTGSMVSVWPRTLIPEQPAIMTFEAAAGVVDLGVLIQFTDEAGYRWMRTDETMPQQIHDDTPPAENGSDEPSVAARRWWKFWA
ncbi:hypothetical protein FK529_08845 [Tsukamurella asaccharolytica]|uniref:Uncharacterized protein n=1 Tax=Tsukamurella asaccharolytica TaxID=2592067 RepID=A0A5C5RC42_9ACTN|nr:hypothetical protein [Tsukamurella asaccharolytica]TWS20212.1 hypothetical protein FK529_08845 [Tsukamurella asaccharolytica]